MCEDTSDEWWKAWWRTHPESDLLSAQWPVDLVIDCWTSPGLAWDSFLDVIGEWPNYTSKIPDVWSKTRLLLECHGRANTI